MAENQEEKALVARYEKASTDTQRAKILLDTLEKLGTYAAVRRAMGQGPGWTERTLDKLTGSHPEASMGRKRNGATRTPAKKAPAKAAPKAEAEQEPAKKPATRKAPAKRAAKKSPGIRTSKSA